VCVLFVRHSLSPDQTRQRDESSADIIGMIDDDKCVLRKIVTGY
jgi:hypothetical protein